ncbi:MAG: nucleoside-diphosphate sugar epimerase/dehydratase [Steroidobacteraceae bacterium]
MTEDDRKGTVFISAIGSGLVDYQLIVVRLIEAILVVCSYYAAFALRFDGKVPPKQLTAYLQTVPWLLGSRFLVAYAFRMHHRVWRYTGLWDLINLSAAEVTATILFATFVALAIDCPWIPRTVYVIDTIVVIALLGGARALRRILYEQDKSEPGRRVLIFGAGDAGELIVRDMLHNADYGYSPVGFVDDDRMKVGRMIHGIRVLGTRADMRTIISAYSPQEVLIAMPRMGPETIRGILRVLEPFGLPIKILPSLPSVLEGRVRMGDVRGVALEDLLCRRPVGLDPAGLRGVIEGQSVLITGAGGSIGSELCRQISALKPRVMVMYERYENGLYNIEQELRDRNPGSTIAPVVGDVCDGARLEQTFRTWGVKLVFHAAAHKHVPLMELNPCEAIKNNVRGTRVLAEVAARAGVDRLVLISTDKAVNPTSIMGASKRTAELVVKAIAEETGLRLGAVRFGNVLGSNGSVVPRFLEQIRAGGPVTVTDPGMQRFLMLIPEAVQLVLHAATLMNPGATYLLEMGAPTRIAEMARHLIQLSGLVPDRDIAIEYVGVRPGEKLCEETFAADEKVEPSGIPGILRVLGETQPEWQSLLQQVEMLEQAALAGDAHGTVRMLRVIVPTFDGLGVQHGNGGPVGAAPSEPHTTQNLPGNGAEPDMALLMEPVPSK